MASYTYAYKKENILVRTKRAVRDDWRNFKRGVVIITAINTFLGLFIFLPFLFLNFYFIYLYFHYSIYRKYLDTKAKLDFYKRILLPVMADKHFVQVGIEIYKEDFLEYARRVRTAEYNQHIVAKREPERIVGLSKDQMTTHFWVIGTTGAGKTAFYMTLFQKHLRQGGGLIFVDGKADDSMLKKLYSIARDSGRENDFYVINFLNPDKKYPSNTFNIVSSFPPPVAVEFLASLLGDASGDAKYWQERGIVLLRPIIYFLGFRLRYFNEPFSYENVRAGMEQREFAFLSVVTYCLLKALEEKLSQDMRLKIFLKEAKKVVIPRTEFQTTEMLRSYFIQRADMISSFEELGYDYTYIQDLFTIYKYTFDYLGDISASWKEGTEFIATYFYDYLISQVRENPEELSITNYRDYYKKFISIIESGNLSADALGETELFKLAKQNPDMVGQKAGAFFNVDEKALQQMNYGLQQWSSIISTLETFSHIFGALEPEIDFVEIIRNNKILYILLPPLEQSNKTVELLGTIVITAIRQATATTLGGNISGTATQMEIFKDRIKPKPLFLVALDEYGSYPVSGLDTILAQVRSLNFSVWIATQDYTSGRTGGTNENAVKRLWANTQKVILRDMDTETADNLIRSLGEVEVFSTTQKELGFEDYARDSTIHIEKRQLLSPEELREFKNGLGVIITDGMPVFFHSFWADAPVAPMVKLPKLRQLP